MKTHILEFLDFITASSPLTSELNPIPPKAKHLMGIIENSHRADDEYFLMIHSERCKEKRNLSKKPTDGKIHGISSDLIMVKG